MSVRDVLHKIRTQEIVDFLESHGVRGKVTLAGDVFVNDIDFHVLRPVTALASARSSGPLILSGIGVRQLKEHAGCQ